MAKFAKCNEPVLVGPEILRREEGILPDGTKVTIPIIGDVSICHLCFLVLAESSDRFILQAIPHKRRVDSGVFLESDADIYPVLKCSREVYLCPEDILELMTGYNYTNITELPDILKKVRSLLIEEHPDGLENDETD